MLLSCFEILILTLLCLTFHSEQLQCPKKTFKTTAPPTKCVAGRRLYANWSFYKIPGDDTNVRQVIPPPWLAVITSNYAGVKSVCSGSLINDRYVVTAQRCVLPPLEPEHVTIGLANGIYPTSEVILHPDFDQTNHKTSGNDLALLKVALPLRFTRKLLPLQLVAQIEVFDELQISAATSGFTQVEANTFKSEFVTLRGMLIRQNNCKNFSAYYSEFVTKQQFCFKNHAVNDDCFNLQGMMGAPLTIEKQKRIYRTDVLIGVLSWWWPKNRPCSAQENPFVFVNVQEKLGWILNNTRDGLFCRY